MSENLNSLRTKIQQLDDDIFRLIAERLDTAKEIGKIKQQKQLPIKDYSVEKAVVENNIARGKKLNLYEDLSIDISKLLIKYACVVQDEYRGRENHAQSQSNRSVLVVGGGGQMGQWIAQYFSSYGDSVSIYDPKATANSLSFPLVENLDERARSAEVIALATPINETAPLVDRLSDSGTRAVVFDIASVKSPLIPSINRAIAQGIHYVSIHPMFGPDAQYLVGKNILICEHEKAPKLSKNVFDLFKNSTATLVKLPLSEHDKYIGYVLGLSHLSNLLFGTVLSKSNVPYERFLETGSTTFKAQAEVTQPVVEENQDLYFDIQVSNNFSQEMIKFYRQIFEHYCSAIKAKDKEAFKKLMTTARDFFHS